MSGGGRGGRGTGRRPWFGLQAELDSLERSDPAVRKAREGLRQLPDDLARYERHMAARKAVGKRAVPDELRRQGAAEEGKYEEVRDDPGSAG